MKKYLNYFKWYFVIIGILIVANILVFVGHEASIKMNAKERSNSETLTDERVFDYGEVLSDKEEEYLRKLIAKREKQINCDIVLVTINESLEDYVKPYEEQLGDIDIEEYATVYADNFYDENKFGYNEAYGDGAVLVDNRAKESDGYRYTAFSTAGKVEYKYGDAMVDRMLDLVVENINDNPFRSYKRYINTLADDMLGRNSYQYTIPEIYITLMSILVIIVFAVVHLQGAISKKTTGATTYVNGGRPKMNVSNDVFLRKRVTKQRIESSSGGSGSSGGRSGGGSSHSGGHHTSAGGHSHGGGSRRH